MAIPTRIRFTQSARKHRVGQRAAREVIASVEPTVEPMRSREGAAIFKWIGSDARGRELEIVGIDRSDYLLDIHVMPTTLRRKP